MPRFPRREAEIVAYADDMIRGLKQHRDKFQEADLEGLEKIRSEYTGLKSAQEEKWDAYQEATTIKDGCLKELVNKMKEVMKQASRERSYKELRLIGWGGETTKEGKEQSLPPGAPRRLAAEAASDKRVTLNWKAPARSTGGETSHYEIYRREAGSGEGGWNLIGTSFKPHFLITEHPEGAWEFRVLGRNKKGESEFSNTVELKIS